MPARTKIENSTRKYGFKNSTSKDGSLSAHISKYTNDRLARYCKEAGLNRTRFIEECINEKLETAEKDLYMSKSKEELVEILLAR